MQMRKFYVQPCECPRCEDAQWPKMMVLEERDDQVRILAVFRWVMVPLIGQIYAATKLDAAIAINVIRMHAIQTELPTILFWPSEIVGVGEGLPTKWQSRDSVIDVELNVLTTS